MEIVTLFYYKKWMICLTPINWSIMKLFFLFIIILNLFSCGDDGRNCPGDIKLPIEIVPYNLFYSVGDTITLTSKFHKLIHDNKTDNFYDASFYRFSPYVQLFALDSSVEYNSYSRIKELANYFINSEGNKFNVSLGELVGEYRLIGDTLDINIKLIFLRKGFMMLRFGSLSSGDSQLQNNYQFNCRGRDINFSLESSNNNIEILQKFRSNERNSWILSDSINRFYNHAGYCFEVR